MSRIANEHPVELVAPDISVYRAGNTGIPYYTTLDSGRAGPHVLINALVHGNELCGALALDHLLKAGVRPSRGRLSLGFANIAAYLAFDPRDPTASRYVAEDFNRLWDASTLDGSRRSIELDRAREIRPLIDTVDLMLDIHSMQNRTPPLMLSGPLDKGRKLAIRLAAPAYVVVDAGHAAGRRLRDYGGFGEAGSDRNALLVECGQHWESAAEAVAIETCYRFLLTANMIPRDLAEPWLPPHPERQSVVEVVSPVTIETDRFRFAEPFVGMEIVEAGRLIGWDGDREVRAPFDDCVLIMPSRRSLKGQTAVRLGRHVA